MRGGRAWAGAMAAMLAAALAAGCHGDGGESDKGDGQAGEPTGVLFRFEEFTSAPLVDGGEITLRSLEGKVVLLDLFGTWCPPCRRSVPIIVSVYERFHAGGLEVVGLAYEQTADAEQARRSVQAFREEFKIPYPLALGPDGVWDDLRKRANAEGNIPTLVLIDRQGVVREMFQGLSPGEEAILADRIERLLAEPAVPVPH